MTARQQQAKRRRQHLRQLARERQIEREIDAHLRWIRRVTEQRRIHAEYVREMRGVTP